MFLCWSCFHIKLYWRQLKFYSSQSKIIRETMQKSQSGSLQEVFESSTSVANSTVNMCAQGSKYRAYGHPVRRKGRGMVTLCGRGVWSPWLEGEGKEREYGHPVWKAGVWLSFLGEGVRSPCLEEVWSPCRGEVSWFIDPSVPRPLTESHTAVKTLPSFLLRTWSVKWYCHM